MRRRPVGTTGRRPTASFGAAVLSVAVTIAGAMLMTPVARSAQGASATAKIAVLFKSVTISTTKLTYAGCTGGYSTGGKLGFPNAKCTTGNVKVSNGAVTSTILVVGTNAVPSDKGKHWELCGGPGAPSCTVTKPGVDQFSEQDGGVRLGLRGACDLNFAASPCGHALAHQGKSESLALYGPKSSTDRSPTFTTEITWTAS